MIRRGIALIVTPVILIAAAIAGIGSPTTAIAAALGSTPSTTECTTSELHLAPRLQNSPDLDPNGHPITISPGPSGMFVPVVVVNGWNGRSFHDDSRAGNFSGRIDLTANAVGTVAARTSLIGQLQDMAGSAVYTFDYHQWSDRWVTDPHIGDALATAIDCLYTASGQKVILVAHSMGGLAIEQTFSRSLPGAASRAGEISTIVTMGTPFKGSVMDSLAHGTVVADGVTGALGGSPFLTLTTAILAACGRISTADADSICTKVNALTPVTTIESDAANALQYGSAQIRKLPSIPTSIHLVQLAGNADYSTSHSWFREVDAAVTLHLGDTIVTSGSAIPSPGREHSQVACAYTVNASRAVGDEAGVILGVVSKVDAQRFSVPIVDSSVPCGHGQLTRDIELTNDALGAVYDDIHARVEASLKAAVESITVPAGVCYDKPAMLNKGAFTIPGTNGDGGIGTVPFYDGDDVSNPTSTSIALLADGRSQMSDADRGAIAVSLGCSASGAGGGYSYIAVYTNDLRVIGLIDPGRLTTAGGAGLPGFSNASFANGKLRTDVGWMAFTTAGACPLTKVRTDYAVLPATTLAHGPLTTLQGDPSCGAPSASTKQDSTAVALSNYLDTSGLFDSNSGLVYSWDAPDHSVRCSTFKVQGPSDAPAVGCMAINPSWKLTYRTPCHAGDWSGFNYDEGGIGPGCGNAPISVRGYSFKAKVLPKGETIAVNGLTCKSAAAAMTCTYTIYDSNVKKVQGFTLSRSMFSVRPSYAIVR
ncbi:esterase/lipase family protein [uncultured Amnibacterium sp.]|uniref:esterase/lipase family protein n=1 Tax=uncultured Amnibacterium sp. TaxID=1631851 RepID=UPI0035CC1F77